MIPDYQTLMLPLLKIVADGKEYHHKVFVDILADQFNLTETERRELLPSGNQAIFENRVGWAKTYLKKAGLLDSPKRAIYIISPRGKEVLSQNPQRIDAKFLRQFPEFLDFQIAGRSESTVEFPNSQIESTAEETPEELLDKAYQQLRQALANDLLNKVLSMSPAFFERLVVELLVKMGYGGSMKEAGKSIGRSGDEGIDGTIKEDKLGLDVIYLQAKRWKPGSLVGRPELQKFVGALAGQGAKKGIFITTSAFTRDALEYTPRNETKIVLIDGQQLTQFMIDYNVGCAPLQSLEIKKIDNDFFEDI